MTEELEQSDKNQAQLEQSNGNQDQLIEIYKLQAQLANSISNRRITINRFYILVMSGLALIFAAFFKLPTEIQKLMSIGDLVVGLAFLGVTLSLAWFVLINSNLRLSMIKYEALKKLEDKLDYQFFQDEWKFLEKYGRHRTYWEISYIEIFIPVFFFILFTLLLHLGALDFSDKPYHRFFSYYPSILSGSFCYTGFRSWQIDREIRGFKRWSDEKVLFVSITVSTVILILISLFRAGYSGGAAKESEVVNKKPAETTSEKPTETSSEKSTKEQIIRPDGKEQKESESVDEQPTGTTSEEAVKEQPISPDGKEQNESQ